MLCGSLFGGSGSFITVELCVDGVLDRYLNLVSEKCDKIAHHRTPVVDLRKVCLAVSGIFELVYSEKNCGPSWMVVMSRSKSCVGGCGVELACYTLKWDHSLYKKSVPNNFNQDQS